MYFIKYGKLKSSLFYYVMIIEYLNARNVLKEWKSCEYASSQAVSVQ